MTSHLSKQDGRGAGSWSLKQQLFALVFCCVPLDELFWIARLISAPFSLLCHWQVSSCTPPAKPSLLSHLLLFFSLLPRLKGEGVKGCWKYILWAMPFLSAVLLKPNLLSWQVREIISAGNYNWRRGGCSGQWHRGCKGREGGRLKPIYPMVRHRSTHFQLPCPHPQTNPDWKCWSILREGLWAVPSHSSCSSPCWHSDPITASGKDWWGGWFSILWI